MAVADTAYSILDNPTTSGGGGGGTTDVTIFSSRNTITTEEVSPGEWDVNVAGEESLRYVVSNFHEFMEAVVDIGERKARGETTSCVIQVVDDIFFTDATLADEDYYTVNGTKLIDVANKTFLFDWHLFYTTIMCEGTQRHLQLLYPDGNNIDTWQIRVNRLRLNNVRLGGGISLYNKHNSTSSSPQHCNFSRYLLASQVNLNYDIRNCQITCCGADNNLSNKFIYEGNGTHIDDQYHTTIVLSNCNFFYGGDAGNNYWSNLNAPIVIYSILTTTKSNQRNITFEKLTKYIGNSSSETGCPNIQFRTVDNSDHSYDTIAAWWGNHHWRVTSDGTCLVSSQIADTIDLKTRLALNDLYIQGQPTLQPAGATPTYNWVSLVEELNKRKPLNITENSIFSYLIGQNIDDNHSFVRIDPFLVFDEFFELSWNYVFFDAHGHIDVTKTMYLIPINVYIQLCGILYGSDYGISTTVQSIYAECVIENGNTTYTIKNSLIGVSEQGLKSADIEFVEYNGEKYLALIKNWSGGDLFLKGYSTITQEEIDENLQILYYDGTRSKWYSDSSLTQEASFTVEKTAERFPATLDFGGTSSQVVAGDGSLLSYPASPLNNGGEMTQQAYNDMGSHDPNTIYIITD